MDGIDWRGLFVPEVALLEIVVRGTVVYLGLVLLLRLVLKREAGALNLPDLLVVVLLADAVQNGMAGDYRTITGALVLALTIIGWNVALDWVAYRVPAVRRLLRPRPLPLVRDGRILRRNLRQEFVTEDELLAHLRLHGVDHVSQVKEAFMEGDGRISVVTRDAATDRGSE